MVVGTVRHQVLLNLALLSEEESGVNPSALAEDGVDEALAREVLDWADRLSLANPVRQGRWRLDPAVAVAVLSVGLTSGVSAS